MGGLQASPHPCSHFSAFLSITEASLADWLLRIKSLGNPVVRFDASLASLLALPVGMAVASQSKGALCWNLGHRPRPRPSRARPRWFPSHPTLKPGLGLIWAGCSVRKGRGPDTGPAAQGGQGARKGGIGFPDVGLWDNRSVVGEAARGKIHKPAVSDAGSGTHMEGGFYDGVPALRQNPAGAISLASVPRLWTALCLGNRRLLGPKRGCPPHWRPPHPLCLLLCLSLSPQ